MIIFTPFFLPLLLLFYFFPLHIASAHEAYVLPYDTFWSGLKSGFSLHAFDALKNPHDLYVAFVVGISIAVLIILSFFFRRSRAGKNVSDFFEKFSYLGPHFMRITIAIAFFFSAITGTFLGPEIHGSLFPFPHILQISLFAISLMIAVGFMTELAALAGIIIFFSSFFIFGSYIFNYLNYLGELIVLLLFGMRMFSFDKYLFGPLRRFQSIAKYETLIVRVLYGLALIYAAVTVKLLHPDLTILVVNTWHLTKFHLLFPSDPLLVTLGAGLTEIMIGLFIIFGFEMRLTIFISLFYITLSLFYFGESVWPHLLLYGISLNLLVQPETFTIDNFLLKYKWFK